MSTVHRHAVDGKADRALAAGVVEPALVPPKRVREQRCLEAGQYSGVEIGVGRHIHHVTRACVGS